MRHYYILSLLLFIPGFIFTQNTNWQTKLGYTTEDKLLIIHGDDLGVTHSVNKASFDGFENGLLNSCSIMMPCPWFEEAREYFLENPDLDYGLHLTLTAEWKHFKWAGLSGKNLTPGLHNESGYLHHEVPPVVANSNVAEVELEVRAQIDKALNAGLHPTHLDSHMGTLFAKEEFIALLINLGEEYQIPVFLPAQIIMAYPNLKGAFTEHTILTNNVYMNNVHLEKEEVFKYYNSVIEGIEPGLNELIVHLGLDNEELKATCIDHPAFGSAWRQHDLDYIKSDDLKKLLKENNIKLVTWKEIGKAIYDK